MAKPGRKSRATPEFIDKLIKDIENVYYLKTACRLNQIDPGNVLRWVSQGKQHERMSHPDFGDCTSNCEPELIAKRKLDSRIKQAQAKFTETNMRQIQKHAKKTFPAAAWLLERTQPDEFGVKQRVEHTGQGGGPIIHKFLSPERRKAIAEAALKGNTINTRLEGDVYVPDED